MRCDEPQQRATKKKTLNKNATMFIHSLFSLWCLCYSIELKTYFVCKGESTEDDIKTSNGTNWKHHGWKEHICQHLLNVHVTSTANSTVAATRTNERRKKKSPMLIAINRICCTHNGTSLSVYALLVRSLLNHRSTRCQKTQIFVVFLLSLSLASPERVRRTKAMNMQHISFYSTSFKAKKKTRDSVKKYRIAFLHIITCSSITYFVFVKHFHVYYIILCKSSSKYMCLASDFMWAPSSSSLALLALTLAQITIPYCEKGEEEKQPFLHTFKFNCER